MKNDVCLHTVQESDLPVLFEQQLDPEATRMAAVPARDRDAFWSHWQKVLADEKILVRTITLNGEVAGHIVSWEQEAECRVGYWLGKQYWGMGIASEALRQFLEQVKVRPLHARVARHNIASLHVLQKCGFTVCGEDRFPLADGEVGEEFILILGEVVR